MARPYIGASVGFVRVDTIQSEFSVPAAGILPVHSMGSGPGFAELDRRAAVNFGMAAARAGVRRIIYLGGLGDAPHSLSTHLKSRIETGEALCAAGVPVVEFRASIVVGAGSLSFEMIRALVERLPIMICQIGRHGRSQSPLRMCWLI